jgi:hypothetical protein
LGVRGSIVPAASRTEYSSFWKAGVRDSFLLRKRKSGADVDSAQPEDTSNTNDLCLPILDFIPHTFAIGTKDKKKGGVQRTEKSESPLGFVYINGNLSPNYPFGKARKKREVRHEAPPGVVPLGRNGV